MFDGGKDGIILKRFGKYLLLDHIVDGGMAQIVRARTLGEQVDKIVAIKVIQQQFTKDQAFKIMFMDEIKVTFGLIHPNIAQTYDYGSLDGQLFTAMEYVDGKNLKEYLEKLKNKRFVFPVEITAYIISQVCQGLHYAHTLTDKLSGKKLSIIHRDISPHNIMLTYDGAIKVIDFGIAKSATNADATQTGTIKGKLSYLAPEYLDGIELDHRYDEFSLGITMWEMLCSRKLFVANNDLAVLKQIQKCKIPPPSSINPNVPKELDEIVLKALSKNRKLRYENLDQLNRALVKFLYSNYSDFNSTDLSYFAKELFKDEIKKDRVKLYKFGKVDIKPFIEELKRPTSSIPREESLPTINTDDLDAKKEEVIYDFGFKNPENRVDQSAEANKKVIERHDKTAGNEIENSISVQKTIKKSKKKRGKLTDPSLTKSRTKELELKKIKSGDALRYGLILLIFVVSYYIFFGSNDSLIFSKKDNTKSEDSLLIDDSNVEKTKVVLIDYDSIKHRIYLNGKRVNVSVFKEIKVPIGRDIYVRVQKEGEESFIKKVHYNNNSSGEEIRILPTKSASYSYLITSSACVKGKLFLNIFGEPRVELLPLSANGGLGLPMDVDQAGNSHPTKYSKA